MAEELFFRGLLQNLFGRLFESRELAQACASILFGLFPHSSCAGSELALRDLATLAGWFYGWAYRKHRSLMASATNACPSRYDLANVVHAALRGHYVIGVQNRSLWLRLR